MAGWIKLSRDIQSHWIYQDPVKLKWWIDILLTVNFEDKKTSIGYKVFDCKRGESLISLQNWAAKWKVSKSVVRNFFTMLENDNMIRMSSETVTTRLTVCNYDVYQLSENASDTHLKRKRNGTKPQQDTTKEGEEGEEQNKKENTCFSFDDFWKMYDKKVDSKKCKEKYEKLTDVQRAKIKQTLPSYLATIKDKQFQKNPSTYLHNECWNDEIVSGNTKQQPTLFVSSIKDPRDYEY
jgi:hypothetical protein